MKSFDDIFKESVEKIFSDYKTDHLADEGWNSFVAAGKGKRKLRAAIPLWARAASIALFIATGALITFLVINRKITENGLISSVTEQEKKIAVSVHSGSESSISPTKDKTIGPLLDESTEPVPGEPAELVINKTTESFKDETMGPVIKKTTESVIDKNTKHLSAETTEPFIEESTDLVTNKTTESFKDETKEPLRKDSEVMLSLIHI